MSRVAGPDTEVIQRESDEAVIAALNTLAPGDREILLLNAWEGMPSSRLAERFAISPKAAEKRLTRAHGRLTAALDKVDVRSKKSVTTPRAMKEGGSR